MSMMALSMALMQNVAEFMFLGSVLLDTSASAADIVTSSALYLLSCGAQTLSLTFFKGF